MPSKKGNKIFKKHKNLIWLLPVLVVVCLVFLVIRHHMEEEISVVNESSPIKQEIMQKVNSVTNMGSDDNTANSK